MVAAVSAGSKFTAATGRPWISAIFTAMSLTTAGLLLLARIVVQAALTTDVGLLAASAWMMLGSDVAETPAALKWALGTRAPMLVPQFANERWSLDVGPLTALSYHRMSLVSCLVRRSDFGRSGRHDWVRAAPVFQRLQDRILDHLHSPV